PRTTILFANGYDYIGTTEEKFDVILVDSSDPIGPSAVLHRREFFAKLKKILKPRGIIAAQSGSAIFQLESIRQKRLFLEQMFRYAYFYLGPVPTYPGGLWCYLFLSDWINPLRGPRKEIIPGLKYYSQSIHRACFSLPPFFLTKGKNPIEEFTILRKLADER
ncbi:MAG: spermidine synthase, partial [Candidatus Aminicenantes bacterium]|nr:spermidine synthase [Candidatus Aminicenantes bacterium]